MKLLEILKAIIDIGSVTLILYGAVMLVLGTKAMQIFRGVIVILVVWLLSGVLGLETLKFLISQTLIYGLLALIIIFQPELRNALERLGKHNLRSKFINLSETGKEHLIGELVDAVEYMSQRKIGALISIEIEDTLEEYIKTGIRLDAEISKELLTNIFSPNVPLHDGALIIKSGRIESASCYLPLSEDDTISKELGTRHRAAIGLSEETDAFTIVVSEETGLISISKDSEFSRGISPRALKNQLRKVLEVHTKTKSKRTRNKDKKRG